jgi:hypothetical protein
VRRTESRSSSTLIGDKCAMKAAGPPRMQLPPANWFAPPDGSRSRLLRSNEKAQFSRDPCDQQGGTGVPLPGLSAKSPDYRSYLKGGLLMTTSVVCALANRNSPPTASQL